MFRKNLQPLRVSGGVFYSYRLSGSNAGQTTYPADIVNTQLIVEDVLDDKRDVGFRNGVLRCSQSVRQLFTKRPELVGLVGNRSDVTKRESALGAAILL